MLKKLGKRVTRNLGLKIFAVIFAIVLWIVVVNLDDPVKTVTYTTSVTYENTDYIASLNKYYEVLDASNTVTFAVSAQRSVHEKISSSDFTATADMSKIEYDESTDSYRVPVQVSVSSNKISSSDATVTTKQLYKTVALDDLGTTQLTITAETSGEVADGCALGEVSIASSNLIRISGPASVVSQVSKAVATINVDGLSADATDSVVPVLYDAEGNVVDTTKLTLSMNTVSVRAEILNTKSVSLEFSTTGEPAEGYLMTDLTYEPTSVMVKGEAATLNPVNRVTVPADVLDITGATSDIDTTVDISSYLPDGISLVNFSDSIVRVHVTIEPVVTKTFALDTGQFAIENLRDGLLAELDTQTVYVSVTGPQSVINSLTEDMISGTVNLSGLLAGEHEVTVAMTVDEEDCAIYDEVVVTVIITGTPTSQESTMGLGGSSTGTSGTGLQSGGSNGLTGQGGAADEDQYGDDEAGEEEDSEAD